MKPKEQREAIKSFLAQHLLTSLDPEKMNDKSIPKPSASMLNVALSFLKATDGTLGQPTPEEVQEQQAAIYNLPDAPLMADGKPFVYRIPADGFDLPEEPVVDAEGNVTNVTPEYVDYMRSKMDDDEE